MPVVKELGRLLALDPCARGVGYVVIEDEKKLIDWGVRDCKLHDEASYSAAIYVLLDRFRPDVIVMERQVGSGCRRGVQARCNIDTTRQIAEERGVKVFQYSVRQVRAVFAQWQALTKDERAQVLVKQLPQLEPYKPPRRRPWTSEDRRWGIFDALSFAVTHQHFEHRRLETIKTIPF